MDTKTDNQGNGIEELKRAKRIRIITWILMFVVLAFFIFFIVYVIQNIEYFKANPLNYLEDKLGGDCKCYCLNNGQLTTYNN